MADLALQFGGDLALSPTGDIALAAAAQLTQQRVLRRLLTNPGDYIWQLTYGAGLGQFVGGDGTPASITGLVRTQILLEAAVAPSPAPAISASTGEGGMVTLTLQYADAATGQSNGLSLSM